jgi:hypothetical protein
LDATSSIDASGIINRADMVELAEGFALPCHIPGGADWARFLRAISRAHAIK